MKDDFIQMRRADVLRLYVRAELAPLIAERGYHPGTIIEWGDRCIASGVCDLDGEGNLRQRVPIADWLDEASKLPGNRHLAQSYGDTEPTQQRDARFGGMSQDEFAALSPRAKLEVANRDEAAKRSKN